MTKSSVKDDAKRLIERLPETATWDDVMHEIYVRQTIEAGLADSEAGRSEDVAEVRKRLSLSTGVAGIPQRSCRPVE